MQSWFAPHVLCMFVRSGVQASPMWPATTGGGGAGAGAGAGAAGAAGAAGGGVDVAAEEQAAIRQASTMRIARTTREPAERDTRSSRDAAELGDDLAHGRGSLLR